MFKLGTVICSTYDKRIAGPIVGYGVVGWDGEAGEPVYLIQTAPASSSLGPACRVVRQSHVVLAEDANRSAIRADYCPAFVGLSKSTLTEMCEKRYGHEGLHESEHWTWASGGVPEKR